MFRKLVERVIEEKLRKQLNSIDDRLCEITNKIHIEQEYECSNCAMHKHNMCPHYTFTSAGSFGVRTEIDKYPYKNERKLICKAKTEEEYEKIYEKEQEELKSKFDKQPKITISNNDWQPVISSSNVIADKIDKGLDKVAKAIDKKRGK